MSDSDDEPSSSSARPQPVDPNAGLHPLFWDAIPENAEDDPNWQALEALKAESTPEERADNFKVQGNNKLRIGLKSKNKCVMREALEFYSQGLEIKCGDPKLNSVLLSNRAHVQTLLGNWRNALQDSLDSSKADAANVKAYFRGAKAALQLGRYGLCIQLCQEGQRVDGSAAEFPALLKEAEQKDGEERQRQEAVRAAKEMEEAPSRELAAAICSRGWRVTLPQVRLENRSRPCLDDSKLFHWPALIVYPENMQQDAIEDFFEQDPVSAHLDVMFGPEAPPLEWDARKEYTRESIELYYLSHAGKPLNWEQLTLAMQGKWPEGIHDFGPQRYGEKAARWKLVDQGLSLGELLGQPDYVVPGVPLFFAVAKGTEYRTRFLTEALK